MYVSIPGIYYITLYKFIYVYNCKLYHTDSCLHPLDRIIPFLCTPESGYYKRTNIKCQYKYNSLTMGITHFIIFGCCRVIHNVDVLRKGAILRATCYVSLKYIYTSKTCDSAFTLYLTGRVITYGYTYTVKGVS